MVHSHPNCSVLFTSSSSSSSSYSTRCFLFLISICCILHCYVMQSAQFTQLDQRKFGWLLFLTRPKITFWILITTESAHALYWVGRKNFNIFGLCLIACMVTHEHTHSPSPHRQNVNRRQITIYPKAQNHCTSNYVNCNKRRKHFLFFFCFVCYQLNQILCIPLKSHVYKIVEYIWAH